MTPRPKLSVETINRQHKRYLKAWEEYKGWYEVEGDEAKQDLFDELILESEREPDGYDLAKYCDSYHGIVPDAHLVEILIDFHYVFCALRDEAVENWVKENNLTIPKDVVGRKINARFYKDYFITGINPETYAVTVREDKTKQGGYVVNFEDVKFLD